MALKVRQKDQPPVARERGRGYGFWQEGLLEFDHSRGSGSEAGDGPGEALASARRDLQLILDALPAFIFYKDTQNRILRVNRAVAESLGVDPTAMENTPTERWYPDEAALYFADDLEVMRSGQPKRGIVEPIHVGKEKRWVQTEKFPQIDASGAVTGIVVVAQDITERVRLEQELSRSRRLDSIGRLAGGVAHDFNNLLTAILGHVEAIQETTPKADPISESLQAIQLAVHRCADLTGQLLAFARKQPHLPQAVDLNQLVNDARRILARVIEENIEFSIDLWPAPVVSLVDAGQLSQVLINIVVNARDAMPNGGSLTISTGITTLNGDEPVGLPPGPFAFFSVEDTGKGMNEEERQRIFEPFFTTKEVGSGTGLGLATSYGIVRKNGGAIEVDSHEGVGTRVRVLLPHTDAELDPAPPHRATPVPFPKNATVLFVEDDAGLRELGARVLSQSGFSVLSAPNGEAAMAMARASNGNIQLLVTDVVMPKMGGFELAEQVKKILPDVHVVFMSGYADVPLLQEGKMSLGQVLAKPFTRKQLLDRIFAALARPELSNTD